MLRLEKFKIGEIRDLFTCFHIDTENLILERTEDGFGILLISGILRKFKRSKNK